MSEQPIAFDLLTARRFARTVKEFFTSEVRWMARGLFAVLILFALTVNGLNVVNSYVGRDFMTAIEHHDHVGFFRQALLFVGVLAATTVVAVFYRFYGGAARAVLAGMVDPAGDPAIPRESQLSSPQRIGDNLEPRPAYRRRRPRVHRDCALF